MKKPKWRVNFKLLKNSQFDWRFNWFINKKLLWKEKWETPRIEILPKYLFSWLWFQIDIIQGTDTDWEWWLWVTKYSNNNEELAKSTYPWGKNFEDKWIRNSPWENYNL